MNFLLIQNFWFCPAGGITQLGRSLDPPSAVSVAFLAHTNERSLFPVRSGQSFIVV